MRFHAIQTGTVAIKQLAYVICPHVDSLSGLSPFCLWLDCFSRCRVIRIGTHSPHKNNTPNNTFVSSVETVMDLYSW
jgi:hypothetical protein